MPLSLTPPFPRLYLQVLSTRGRKDVTLANVKVQVCMYAFDCLYLDGKPLLREPLTTRREALYSALQPVPWQLEFATAKVPPPCLLPAARCASGPLPFCPAPGRATAAHHTRRHTRARTHARRCTQTSRDVEELQRFLDESVEAGTEGLIVKTLQGARTLPAWDLLRPPAPPVAPAQIPAVHTDPLRANLRATASAAGATHAHSHHPLPPAAPLRADSYEPSKRSSHWLKLKKDYLAGVGDTFDVVPLGAWYGRGKRAGVFGSYLLAVYDAESEEYQTISKIGTGFSEELLKSLAESMGGHVIPAPKPYYRRDSAAWGWFNALGCTRREASQP